MLKKHKMLVEFVAKKETEDWAVWILEGVWFMKKIWERKENVFKLTLIKWELKKHGKEKNQEKSKEKNSQKESKEKDL